MTDAYFAGQKAYHQGLSPQNNPHRYCTAEYSDWADGWVDAEYESDQLYDQDMAVYAHEDY